MSKSDIKKKVEKALGEILSDKHDAVINIKFVKINKKGECNNENSSRVIDKK